MTVVYEDNHIIIVNKTASEIVQGDKTGDTPLSETVKLISEGEIPKARQCLYRCYTPFGPPRKRSCCFCQNRVRHLPV